MIIKRRGMVNQFFLICTERERVGKAGNRLVKARHGSNGMAQPLMKEKREGRVIE